MGAWPHVAAPLRREPEFLTLVDASELDRFRDEFGWGEFCEPMGDTLRCR